MTTPMLSFPDDTGSALTSSVFSERAASCAVVSGVTAVGFGVIASCTRSVPHVLPFRRFPKDTFVGGLKTVALLLLAVTLNPGSAAAARS